MPPNHPTAQSGVAPRRRNGRQQACAPCSRRKVACDHRLPVCSRCRRGRISEQCVYAPQRRSTRAAASPPPTPRLQPAGAGVKRSTPPVPEPPPREVVPGYLGATNFTVVIQEMQDQFYSTQGRVIAPDGKDPRHEALYRAGSDKGILDSAMSILSNIPDKASSYLLFRMCNTLNNGWLQIAADRLLDSFWDTLGPSLESGSTQALLDVANLLFENTSHPLKENETDPKEWFDAFSGQNMRWESLGMLFVYCSFGARCLPDADPIIGHGMMDDAKRLRMQTEFKERAWACVQLARHQNSCNTLVLWVLWKHSLVESTVSGDAGMEIWRMHAEVVAMATYLGVHALPGSPRDMSISVQVKRRIYAHIYKTDKAIAMYTGRPPLMLKRYASTPLPLDISDAELFGDVPAAPEKIKENGWRTDDTVHVSTVLRARTMIASVAEDLLGIALQSPDIDATDELLKLRQVEEEVEAQLPLCILYQAGDEVLASLPVTTVFTRMLVRLSYLQNQFFIERLLHRQGKDSTVSLIDISFKLVSLTVVFWTHRDRFVSFQNAFEWLVLQFASPAGGVLCMELLRPQTTTAAPLSVSRSEIILNLGLLVAFLDWTAPKAASSAMCITVKKVIQCVLDEVLNHNPLKGEGADSGYAIDMTAPSAFGLDADYSVDLNEMFSFDFLDTFDWLRQEGVVTI